MKYKWLNNKKNDNLILFLNGWAMDENVVSFLKNDNFDILAINDYREFNCEISKSDFIKYKNKYLIAWSMGVYISSFFEDILKDFNKKIAIAGTTKIIDDKFGIPEKIYNLTVNHFSEKSAEKFIKNMFMENNSNIKIQKTADELKDELISIQNFKPNKPVKYDLAYVTILDKIVPYKNQASFWKSENIEAVELNFPHFVFDKFTSWQEIICPIRN